MNKKVFVSGCFDLLHSGHIAFLKEASKFGDLYVGIGSDKTVKSLKGRDTVNSEQERLYMLKAIKYVKDVFVNKGSGIMDFESEVRKLKPAVFVVNQEGASPVKEQFCKELKIELHVLERFPEKGLPARSTSKMRASDRCTLPYRIDLAGTWIDQPYVSEYHPGWAITLSLEPIVTYFERCGMSTSTRNAAKKIWPISLPLEKPETLAEILFKFENSPGSKLISGAQDAIGICMPGLVRHYYDNAYWPIKFEENHHDDVLDWLEKHLSMVLLWPRKKGLDLLKRTNLNKENVKVLAAASEKTWQAINKKDLKEFAAAFLESFKAQTKMFPAMLDPGILKTIEKYKGEALAWKLAGAGGGGYLILVSENKIKGSMPIKIRRRGSGL